MFKFFLKFKYFDIPLLITCLLLTLLGLALLYSTSLANNSLSVFWKQLIFVLSSLMAFSFFSFFDYHTLTKAHRWMYVITVLLLLYILFFAAPVRGASRWIDLGFFRFQVAEFVKMVVIIGLARLLYLRRGQINSWKILLLTILYILIPASLVFLEPDFGSTIVILSIWAGIILVSPINKKTILIISLIALAAIGLSWKLVLQDFQRDRVRVFLNPELDPHGKGYNVRQAGIAIGSGQLLGRGLGKGLQSQLKFLPERQTDFIFASTAEEVGFLGSLALLALYFYLFRRILFIIRNTKDDLGVFLGCGIFFFFFAHVMVNIGMNLGLLPVTGIPLPFLSAGGSFLIASFIALGILENIAMQSKALRF